MEWSLIQKIKAYPLLGLLLISTIFVLLILHSSNPFSNLANKQAISQSPLSVAISTTIQVIQSPPMLHAPPPMIIVSNYSRDGVAITYKDGENVETGNAPSIAQEPLTKYDKIEESGNATTVVEEPQANYNSSPKVIIDEEKCDVSKGKWVEEPRGSVYTNLTCTLMPDIKNCGKHGKDRSYIYWRWQPHECDIPRFEPQMFLNIVRGKKMAFIGDSLARNQFESLLCLVSQAETPTLTFKDPLDKFQTWHFPSHNFTLMVMWTEFLVQSEERKIDGKGTNSFDIHLDKLNKNWTEKLPNLNYAIISGGNWFFRRNYFYQDNKLIGCTYCKDSENNLPELNTTFVIRTALRAALEFIHKCEECEGLVTLLRTFTFSHFENGSWFDGGYCNKTSPLTESEVDPQNDTAMKVRNMQLEELRRIISDKNVHKNVGFGALDVTRAMMMRADGHPEGYWAPKFEKRVNDCLHWCLPGPVDMWSDLLLKTLAKNYIL